MTSTSSASTPDQFESYKALRYPIASKFFALRAYVMGAIALLEASDASEKCEHLVNAVGVLIAVGDDTLRFVNEVNTSFADIERGHHD